MTNARPNALSLAVAIVISSSIIAADALATRRLQTKSVDISGNEQVEFTQSEVIVKPTLDDDSQPIPKSFTTTYPDQAEVRAGYDVPSEGFTDILSGIEGGVSSVDQFETDENDVARKYTKVLKVGNEGVFRFIHNLEGKELVIEVRGGMIHQDSIDAVRAQLGDAQTLEPFTNVASPEHLIGVLKGANERAGNLGQVDHYVALATLKTVKVEVKGRTFMRLIVSGDQPPALERLGQSLFVNDEALFAAATSAYTQVHLLGKELQQEALDDLLSYHKPVGYVVHAEDETQAYPVPDDYPKLEVTEAPGEIIVFRGQKQNPADIAFVKALADTWRNEFGNNVPPPEATAWVKKDKIKSYQYVIQSNQMAILEELAAQHNTELIGSGQTTFAYDGKLAKLEYYEYLQQALTYATPDTADEFEFTVPHVRFASSIITPTWVHILLGERFRFKPVLRNFLTDRNFIPNIHKVIPAIGKMPGDPSGNSFDEDGSFAGQLLEMETRLVKLLAREAELTALSKAFQDRTTTLMSGIEEKLRLVQINQQVVNELKKINQELEETKDLIGQLEQENKRIPELVKQLNTARAKATNTRNSELAAELGIDNWDDTQPQEEQARLISIKIHEINQVHAHQQHMRQQLNKMDDQREIENSYTRTRKKALASVLGIDLSEDTTLEDRPTLESTVNYKLFKLKELEQELKDIRTPGHPEARPEVLGKLTAVENILNIDNLDTENDVYYRRDVISKEIQTYIKETRQQVEEEALEMLIAVEKALEINVNEGDDKATRLDRIEIKINNDDISESMLGTIEQIPWKAYTALAQKTVAQKRTSKYDKLIRLTFYIEAADWRVVRQQERLLKDIEDRLQIYPIVNDAAKERGKTFLAKLASDLEVVYENDVHLNDNKNVIYCKILELMDEVEETYGDKEFRRARNNEIAHQLNIADYRDDAGIEDQNILIKKKLEQLEEEVFKAGVSEVNEHITAIDNELDRQMARLDPKPRYVLDREVATVREAIEEAESEQKTAKQKLDAIRVKQYLFTGPPAVHESISDGDDIVLNRAMKQVQIRLGLTADDEQTLQERVEDVNDFLEEHGIQRREEIFKKLKTKINLNVQIRDDLSLQEEADDFIDTLAYVDTLVQEASDEVYSELGEQILIRQKHFRITDFLREHYRKIMAVTNARLEERDAKENLDRKKQEIEDPGNIDEQAKTAHEKEMDALGLVLKQKSEAVSKAKEALADYRKAALNTVEEAVGLKPDATDTHEQRINALRNKRLQLGSDDVIGSKAQQLIHKQAHLEGEIKVREAAIERMKGVLKAAEKAVEDDDGPFQYTPRQAKVRAAMDDFMQEHPLKQQALETAIGLAGLAAESGNAIPTLTTFDFNDEFAPIRLQAMVGEHLTFDQASRIVTVFKNLKTHYQGFRIVTISERLNTRYPPHYNIELEGDLSLNILGKVQELVYRARNEMKTGAQQYDNEIHGIAKRAIQFVEHEPGDLKSFSEYFATHSASGKKIIDLLCESLISKVELENYIKAVRGVDGYQTVDEFEHFLGYRHGVNVRHFKKVVQMLSDEGAEEFMHSAFTPVTVTATGPAGMKESVAGMKEYAAAVIANYVLDDIAFDNGRRTVAFLANVQDTLAPYANTLGVSESELIKAIHDTLMQAHAAAVEHRLNDYWLKPSASLVQAAAWYFFTYKPLLAIHTAEQAERLSLANMAFLYLLDLTSRGDYLHRALTPFEHWLEHYDVDLDRTRQYTYHDGIEKISEVGGLAMPLGKAASSVILLRTGSLLFARQYNANPRMYRSISRLVPEMVKSMASGQGVQVPLLHRITPEKVKTLASATAGLVLGPVATVGSYAHGLLSGFTYAQTFGFALASSLTFDFFMNDNKMLTQWLGGPLGRSLDRINRWRGTGETESDYMKRTAIATPQRFNETDEEHTNRVKANNMMYGWTRNENYLQFRERRDRTIKMYEHGWEKYFRDNVPKWSFSHAESIPYSYTLGVFYEWQMGDDQKVHGH